MATTETDPELLTPLPLPPGITSRFIDTRPNNLIFHILESGRPDTSHSPGQTTRPLVLLVHGFPELAYSWRHILPLLSAKGYHVVALDQRGYGRTHLKSPSPENHPIFIPPISFRPLNLIRDVVTLTYALGYTSVSCIVGHDFGGLTAALCALSRPDLFKSAILMSHPTKGSPSLPFNITSPSFSASPPSFEMESALASLPRPRKHYKWYYCTPPAASDMLHPVSSLPLFLRGYFHLKSGDWGGNEPHRLSHWSALELAKMPRYYIMDKADNMREAISRDMATESTDYVSSKSARWLSDQELAVYVAEYTRTGFQGGLNWYKTQTQPQMTAELEIFSGSKIQVPTMFVAGSRDWGSFQEPGALEAMETGKSVEQSMWRGTRFVDGAGHWVNQERPHECVDIILEMLKAVSA